MGAFDISSTGLTVNFSNTKPDEPCEPSGDIFLDYNGFVNRLSESSVSTIVVRGGDDLAAFAVSPLSPSDWYMTKAQRVSLVKLLQSLASGVGGSVIQSNNGSLKEYVNSIYNNYSR